MTRMRDLAVPGRELTGFKVLMWLLAFFGAVGAINVVLVHYALSTFGGGTKAPGLSVPSRTARARAATRTESAP